jgi:N-acetyltransferase
MAKGSMLPFTVIDRPRGRVVGMTTYMNIEPAGPRVEIGSTWYARGVAPRPCRTVSVVAQLPESGHHALRAF